MDEGKPEVHITGMSDEKAYQYLDVTPNDEIRELIKELREEANKVENELSGSFEFTLKHEFANRLLRMIENE